MITSSQRGFTLIELMIVLVIVAVLAAVAYGDYSGYISKSRRADGEAALVGLATAMERHFTENATYMGAASGGNNTGAPDIFSAKSPLDGTDIFYNLTINAATASTYTLRATPANEQANDPCGTLTLNQAGAKGLIGADTGMTVDLCWH
jgi:type IV pilus assembly protein PilE